MTSRATDWLQRFGPLAAVALLFGALTPFASYIGSSARYELDRPIWPTICALALGCAAFLLFERVMASQSAPRALVACVCMLAGPLLFGHWVPGLIVVGSIGATILIPMFAVAIALSRAPARGGAGGVAAFVSLGPIAGLLTAWTLEPRLVFSRLTDMDAALAIGGMALAGSAAAAWLLPWPPSHGTDGAPPPARHWWARVVACMMLAALANLDINYLGRTVGGWALFFFQTIGVPIAAALCILPLSPGRRAGLFLAATLVGRFVGGAVGAGVEYATR
jgi:hypothetical protein